MAAKDDLPILNMSLAPHKKLLVDYVKRLEGVYRFELTRVRNQRTLAQNAYLWGVVYPCVANGIEACWGEHVGATGAHEFCKDRFLRRPVVNKSTGEITGYVARSTRDLFTAEMCDYIDAIIQFAADQLGVDVPPASHYDQSPPRRKAS